MPLNLSGILNFLCSPVFRTKRWLGCPINVPSFVCTSIFIISSRKLNGKSKTLEKIGKELKISKERVRQIEVNSLKKLKKNILKISDQSKDFFIN